MFALVAQAARILGTRTTSRSSRCTTERRRTRPAGPRCALAEVAAEALHRDAGGTWSNRPPRDDRRAHAARDRRDDPPGRRRGREHTVFFVGQGERLEVTHRATSRDQFVRGALRAALWVKGRAPRPLRHARRSRTEGGSVRTCRFTRMGREQYGVVEGPRSGRSPRRRGTAASPRAASPVLEVALLAPAPPDQGRLRRAQLPGPREGARERGSQGAAALHQALHLRGRADAGDPHSRRPRRRSTTRPSSPP